jgi:hypothetical protein
MTSTFNNLSRCLFVFSKFIYQSHYLFTFWVALIIYPREYLYRAWLSIHLLKHSIPKSQSVKSKDCYQIELSKQPSSSAETNIPRLLPLKLLIKHPRHLSRHQSPSSKSLLLYHSRWSLSNLSWVSYYLEPAKPPKAKAGHSAPSSLLAL